MFLNLIQLIAAGGGLEPPRTAPKAAVLPLDDPAIKISITQWILLNNITNVKQTIKPAHIYALRIS